MHLATVRGMLAPAQLALHTDEGLRIEQATRFSRAAPRGTGHIYCIRLALPGRLLDGQRKGRRLALALEADGGGATEAAHEIDTIHQSILGAHHCCAPYRHGVVPYTNAHYCRARWSPLRTP